MRTIRLVVPAVLAVATAACGVPERFPAPPAGVTTVGVEPVANKTGNALVVSGDSYIARWIGREKRTVADVLGKELEKELRDHGFAVGGSGAARLRVVLQRFEPDLPQLAFVSVALTATLTDPGGTVRWSGERSKWLVSTAGAVSLEAAYETAARTVARGLVDGWEPKR